MAKPRSPFAPRARARRRALQAIYQWQINDQSMRKILAQFEEEQDMGIVDRDYFEALLLGVEQHQETLDEALAEYLDRPMAQYFAFAGRKRHDAPWPAGTYSGRYSVIRDGKEIAFRDVRLEIRDAP